MEEMHYSSAIPIEWVTSFQGIIKDYVELYKDNMVGRNILSRRTLPGYVDIDAVLRYQDTGVDAEIVAKGAVPETIGTVGKKETHEVYQFSTAFIVNEKDLEKDPQIKAREVDLGMRLMHRLEDTTVINGNTTYGITGLVGAAQSNALGKIVATGATGADVNNNGAWDASETDKVMDPYDDILNAVARIDDKFANSPMFLLGRKAQMIGMMRKDSERNMFLPDIAFLLTGNANSKDWMMFSEYVPSGYVYLIAKDALFAEMVHAEELLVDANYPRQAGGNYRVELREWLAPIELHDFGGAVQIAIT